jgi:hypothetical protein
MASSWIWLSGLGALVAGVSLLVIYLRGRATSYTPILAPKTGAFDRLLDEHMRARGLDFEAVEREFRQQTTGSPTRSEGNQAAAPGTAPPRAAPHSLTAAAAADGLTPALDMLSRWHSIDAHVFAAVSRLSHQNVEAFTDLYRAVESKAYALGSLGFLKNLYGRVGEVEAAEHFSQAGASAEVPWANNFPKLELSVPGYAAHFPSDTLYFDPSHAFDPSALAGTDHLTVVDTALSHAQAVEQSRHAVDVLQDPGPSVHFPWVTFAVSSFRETRLLVHGHTEFSRAAKNVVVDTTFVGGAAAAGAKTGAVAGAFLGPVGLLVGTLAGGMAGGLAGRHVANQIKRKPLVAAKEGYEVALAVYRGEEVKAAEEVGVRWEKLQKEEQAGLNEALARAESAHEASLSKLKNQLEEPLHFSKDTATRILLSARGDVQTLIFETIQALDPKGRASILDFFIHPARFATLRGLRREEREWNRLSEELLARWSPAPANAAALFDLIQVVPAGRASAEAFAERVVSYRAQGFAALGMLQMNLMEGVIQARARAVSQLKGGWSAIEADASARMAPVVERLQLTAQELQEEIKKAGLYAA